MTINKVLDWRQHDVVTIEFYFYKSWCVSVKEYNEKSVEFLSIGSRRSIQREDKKDGEPK